MNLTQPATNHQPSSVLVRQDFAVRGMTCRHCEHAVIAEVAALPGVTAVNANAAAGNVTIESVHALDRRQVAAAVDEAGYELAR